MCSSDKYIHPDFTITKDMLTTMLKEKIHQPVLKEITGNILAEPKEFLESMKRLLHEPPEFLILVDKKHGLESTYQPDDLVELVNFPLEVTKDSLTLQQVLMDDLLAMHQAAEDEGIRLIIASTYRSYSYQARVYDYWVGELGREEADRVSARPGHSQHQLGTTLDFHPIDDHFADTEAGKWVLAHASEYGFSLSYPKGYEDVTGYTYEPWHYRYMGKEAVKVIDKYFLGVQQFFLEFFQDNAEFFRENLKG